MARIAPLNPPYATDIQAAFDAIMPAGVDPLVLFRTRSIRGSMGDSTPAACSTAGY
jgi:hypothetical protein